MQEFHKEQNLVIFCVAVSGLYLPRVEKVIRKVWITNILKWAVIIPLTGQVIIFTAGLKHLIFDETSKTYDVTLVSAYSLLIFKCYYVNLNRRRFEAVFDLWDSSFKEDLYSQQRQEMFSAKKKYTNRYIKALMIFSFATGFLWSLPQYFNADKKLSHPSGIPYKHASPDYELYVTFELLVTLYACVLGIAFDAMLMVLLSLEQVQLIHLQKSLENIMDQVRVNSEAQLMVLKYDTFYAEVEENVIDHSENGNKFFKDKVTMSTATRDTKNKIVLWIKHHQELIKFHEALRKLYYVPLCVQFGNIVITFCLLIVLNVMQILTITETIVCVIYFFNNYGLFYLTCTYGDSVNQVSSHIFSDAFEKAWYVYPKNIQKLLHIIIMRSQTPLDIVAFDIYPLSSRSFFKIFKTSYTFFTFLYQAMNKQFRHPHRHH